MIYSSIYYVTIEIISYILSILHKMLKEPDQAVQQQIASQKLPSLSSGFKKKYNNSLRTK